jgi:hypothetical protein
MKLILDHAKFDLLPIGEGSVAQGAMVAISDLAGSGIVVQAPLDLAALEAVGEGMVKFVADCKRAAGGLEVVAELPPELRAKANGS